MLGLQNMQMINILVEILQYTYMIMGIIACHLVRKKQRKGWMIWFISAFIAVPIFLYRGMYGFAIVISFYAYINWKGWKEWK